MVVTESEISQGVKLLRLDLAIQRTAEVARCGQGLYLEDLRILLRERDELQGIILAAYRAFVMNGSPYVKKRARELVSQASDAETARRQWPGAVLADRLAREPKHHPNT